MIITGYIESVTPFSYSKASKTIYKKHVLVTYPFYSLMNKILFTVSDQVQIPEDWSTAYQFNFEPVTKYLHEKIFTDFYLHEISEVQQLSAGFTLTIVETHIEKKEIHILSKEQVKGRTKNSVEIQTQDNKKLHVFYWEDNHYLTEINNISTLQLNCRCLQYKNKWINNIEIWRTGMQENFIGSIL